jgi:hypothetical protein
MAITNFIPSLWSASILRELELDQTWTQAGVVNRDYEGQISQAGDRVKINQLGDVTISDYTGTLLDPEDLSDSGQMLVIDQQKSFNFKVDDIDQAQANVKFMGEASRKASRGLNEVSGAFLANLTLGADTQNVLGSASAPITTLDKQNVYEFLVEMSKRLNVAGVPKSGRYVQAPAWLEALLVQADILTKTDGANALIRNNVIGRVANFDIISAPIVPTATDGTAGESDVVVAGHSIALSFAEQIVKTEAYRPEKTFADALKGLHVYGGKLVRPEAVSIAYCQGQPGTFGSL